MWAVLLRSLMSVCILAAAAMWTLKCVDPRQQLPLVRADFPVCVRINPNGDLAKPRGHPRDGHIITSEIS